MVWLPILLLSVITGAGEQQVAVRGEIAFNSQKECMVAATMAAAAVINKRDDISGVAIVCERSMGA